MDLQRDIRRFFQDYPQELVNVDQHDFVNTSYQLVKLLHSDSYGVRNKESRKWIQGVINYLDKIPVEVAEEMGALYYLLQPDYKEKIFIIRYMSLILQDFHNLDEGKKPADIKKNSLTLVIYMFFIQKIKLSGNEYGIGANFLQIIFDHAGLNYSAHNVWKNYYVSCNKNLRNKALNQSAFSEKFT